MKKLIALELEIPDEFEDEEDRYMDFLIRQLRLDDTKIYIPIPGFSKNTQTYIVRNIFTGKYEFVDPIRGF